MGLTAACNYQWFRNDISKMTKMLQKTISRKVSEGKVIRTITFVTKDVPYCIWHKALTWKQTERKRNLRRGYAIWSPRKQSTLQICLQDNFPIHLWKIHSKKDSFSLWPKQKSNNLWKLVGGGWGRENWFLPPASTERDDSMLNMKEQTVGFTMLLHSNLLQHGWKVPPARSNGVPLQGAQC